MANHSIIPEGGPKTIDDFLSLLGIYFNGSPVVRRSTIGALSVKPPETISEKLQMAIPDLEFQMYEWACKQMSESIAK